eukprot:341416_1
MAGIKNRTFVTQLQNKNRYLREQNCKSMQSENDNNNLKRQITSTQQEYNLLLTKNNSLHSEIYVLKQHNSNNERNIHKSQQQNRKLTAINASLKQQGVTQDKRYDILMDKYNKIIKQHSNRERNSTELQQQNR